MKAKKGFILNLISLIMLQGGQYILTLATLPYLARVLSPTQFGVYGFSLAIAQYCVIVTNYGFDLSATKRIAASQHDPFIVSSIFWNVIAAKFGLAIVSLIFVAITCMCFSTVGEHSLSILLASLQVFGAALLPSWLFQGKEKLWGVTVANLVARASGLPLFILFVKQPDDLINAVLVQSFIMIFSGSVAFCIAISAGYVRKATLSLKEIQNHLMEGFPLLVSNLAISLYTVSTVVIMGLVSTNENVGLFSGVDKIRMAIAGVFIILAGAIYPRINAMLADDKNKTLVFIKKVAGVQCGMTIICSLVVYFLADYFVCYGLGEAYLSAITALKIMAPLIFFVTTSVILANYLLLPFGHKKVFVAIPVVMSFVHIIVSIPLCYYNGVNGGAESIFITELLTNITLLYFVIKNGLMREMLDAK